MFELSREGDVHILTMKGGENRIDPDFVRDFGAALDEVVAQCDAAGALVVTGEGKFFCNGLNLGFLTSASPPDQAAFGRSMLHLHGRLVAAPIPVAAALNGHAFAAGALLAMACDVRLMREDRGWLCLPEVDLGIPVPPPMLELLRAKLPPATLRDALLTGRRYSGPEALAAGLADAVAPGGDLLQAAVAWAAPLAAKDRKSFGRLKEGIHGGLRASFEAV